MNPERTPGTAPGSTPSIQQVRLEANISDELTRIRHLQQQLRSEPQDSAGFESAIRSFVPQENATDLEPLLRLLRAAQTALVRHPVAASFVFHTLVEEGRRYSATADGQADAAQLAAHPGIADLRRLWESTSLNVLSDDAANAQGQRLPEGWIDLILDAAAAGNTDIVLGLLNNDAGPVTS